MASLRVVLAALALVVLAAASSTAASQNITTYVPECSWQCLEDSLAAVCSGPTDAECLCDNIMKIGPGSRTCVSSDCSGNTTATTAYHAGYVSYCNDTGHAVDESGHFPPGYSWGAGSQWSTTMATSTSTSMSAAATSTSSPSTTAAAPTAASDSAGGSRGGGGDGSSDLSKGAIAGIAVGGGIACILISGALLFLAFRLGKKHYKKKHEKELQQGPSSRPEEHGGDDDIPKEVEATQTQQQQQPNAQLDGTPINELHAGHAGHAGYAVSGLDPIKELPTHERPAELSAEPISHYDSPVLPPSHWR